MLLDRHHNFQLEVDNPPPKLEEKNPMQWIFTHFQRWVADFKFTYLSNFSVQRFFIPYMQHLSWIFQKHLNFFNCSHISEKLQLLEKNAPSLWDTLCIMDDAHCIFPSTFFLRQKREKSLCDALQLNSWHGKFLPKYKIICWYCKYI